MSGRTIIVVVLAIVCGLSAAIGIQLVMKRPAAPIKTESVLFAAVDVQRGETFDEKMVEVRKVPVAQVPPGALSKLEDVVGRAAHYPMLKGDTLADAKLTEKGAGGGMASLIRPGMRAFTIQTPTLSSSLAGFLLPGNKVDVLLTISNANDLNAGATTTTILQNVEILAVHTNVDSPAANKIDPKEALSVTLLVTPEDASLLDLGQNKGTLHLTLRNPKDTENGPRRQATVADLHLPTKEPAPVVTNPPPVVEKVPEPTEAEKEPELPEITQGMRVVTIEVQNLQNRAKKLLKMGSHVDIFHTISSQNGRSATSLLLQDAVVYLGPEEVSENIPEPGNNGGKRTFQVTLMVEPEEALMLDHGQKTGTFSLSLRHDADQSHGERRQASLSGHHLQVTPPLVTTSIRTLRGTKGGADRVTFPSPSMPDDSRSISAPRPALTLNPDAR